MPGAVLDDGIEQQSKQIQGLHSSGWRTGHSQIYKIHSKPDSNKYLGEKLSKKGD